MNEEFRNYTAGRGWFAWSIDDLSFWGKKMWCLKGVFTWNPRRWEEDCYHGGPLYKAYIWWIIKGPPSPRVFPPTIFPYEICTKQVSNQAVSKLLGKLHCAQKNMGMCLKTWVFVSRWRPSVTLVESLVPWIVSPAKTKGGSYPRLNIWVDHCDPAFGEFTGVNFYVVLIHHNRPYIWVFWGRYAWRAILVISK